MHLISLKDLNILKLPDKVYPENFILIVNILIDI